MDYSQIKQQVQTINETVSLLANSAQRIINERYVFFTFVPIALFIIRLIIGRKKFNKYNLKQFLKLSIGFNIVKYIFLIGNIANYLYSKREINLAVLSLDYAIFGLILDLSIFTWYFYKKHSISRNFFKIILQALVHLIVVAKIQTFLGFVYSWPFEILYCTCSILVFLIVFAMILMILKLFKKAVKKIKDY
jgi:hypothetical protein